MRSLEITTQIGCSVGCSYCPRDKLLKAYKSDKRIMTLDDFKKILSNVPQDVRIDFSGFSEVFLNKEGAKMISYTASKGYRIALYTTLTGFKVSDVLRKDGSLRGIYIEDVFFHQHDGKNFNEREFNRKADFLKSSIRGSFRSAKMEKQWQWSRAGNVWKTERKEGKFTCAIARDEFDHNVVLPDGNVYLCCNDWSLKHCIGNLYETHYDNLDRKSVQELASQANSECACRFCEHFILK